MPTDSPQVDVAQTVTGLVPTTELGFTLMHEHVVLRTPGFAENYPATYPRESIIQRAGGFLSTLRAKGVQTIVDLTTVDLGRDAPLLAEVAQIAGINIVAATGSYHHVPNYFRPRSVERIAELFISDVVDGIAGTSVKAGLVKCAVDEAGMTADIRKLTEAAVTCHRQTGVPISTHSHPSSRSGLEQAELLIGAGADAEKVVIGHCGDTGDLVYLRQILSMGCNIGMDRFGLEDSRSTADRCSAIASLCADGFDLQIVLSHDAFCFNDSVSSSYRDRCLPNWRMDFLVDVVIPTLLSLGVSDSAIENMTINNPRRILALGTGEQADRRG